MLHLSLDKSIPWEVVTVRGLSFFLVSRRGYEVRTRFFQTALLLGGVGGRGTHSAETNQALPVCSLDWKMGCCQSDLAAAAVAAEPRGSRMVAPWATPTDGFPGDHALRAACAAMLLLRLCDPARTADNTTPPTPPPTVGCVVWLIVGDGTSCDACGVTCPHPQREPGAGCRYTTRRTASGAQWTPLCVTWLGTSLPQPVPYAARCLAAMFALGDRAAAGDRTAATAAAAVAAQVQELRYWACVAPDVVALPDIADGWSALHWAASTSGAAVIAELLNLGAKLEAVGRERRTPLHVAALSNNVAAARALCAAGANVEAMNCKYQTPLFEAAAWASTEAMEVLISNGSDLHAQSVNGDEPIHAAARREGMGPTVERLLERGVSRNTRNARGLKAEDLAATRDFRMRARALLARH